MGLIETARLALWTCIDNYSELIDGTTETQRKFTRCFKGDDSDDGLVLQRALDPSLGEIPAFAIRFGHLKAIWDQNQKQNWDMRFGLLQWTPDWHQPIATELFETVIRGFWKYQTTTPPSSTDNHIKLMTGWYPREYGIEKLEFVELGKDGPHVTRIEGYVTLRSNKNPFTD